MDFPSFVKAMIMCFHSLAWPIFSLGYPLVASVQAIETNSDTNTRKSITYWVMFSLISLFEHAFTDLIQWVPMLWHYVKLTIVIWLTIPGFNGAFHVYNNFVHPSFSMDLETVIIFFRKIKHLFSKRDNDFLALAEKYVMVNGPEASEKLVLSEKHSEQDIVLKDEKSSHITEKKEVIASEEIPQPENKMLVSMETPTLPQVQKEWTCAMCQVTVKSEIDLKSHLKGRRHRAMWIELMKPKNHAPKAPKAKVSTTTVPKNSDKPKNETEKKKPENIGRMVEKNKPSEVKNSPWQFQCSICNITCSGHNNMAAHLKGKKHLSMIQDQKLSPVDS